MAAGAFTPSLDGALFIFKSTQKQVEDFVAADPYVQGKLVTSVDIKEWNVVIGKI